MPSIAHHHPPTPPLSALSSAWPGYTLAAVDVLQVGAIVLLLAAVGALVAAVLAARRKDGGNGGKIGAEELRTLMEQADQLAEGLAGDLDARAARLEALIREADARLAKLERAEGGNTQRHGPLIANGMIEPSPPPPHMPPNREDPITREIYRLSDSGLPPVEIAKQLSQHTGKVELILALRQG